MSHDLIKDARSRAKDPVQEHLREHKGAWNKDISGLINLLIGLKSGVNGKPVSGINVEKTKITEPLPDVLNTLARQVHDRFTSAFNDLNSIFAEQEAYSEQFASRKAEKSRQKLERSHSNETETEPVPLTASMEMALIKEATNPFTRLWTYIATPFRLGDKDRWARVRMLRASVKLIDYLKDIDRQILSVEPLAVPKTVFSASSFATLFMNDLIEPLMAIHSKHIEQEQLDEEYKKDEQSRQKTEEEVAQSPEGAQQDGGFNDVANADGNLSIPKKKFDEMISANVLSVLKKTPNGFVVMMNIGMKSPRFKGFENFLQPGAQYLVSLQDGRVVFAHLDNSNPDFEVSKEEMAERVGQMRTELYDILKRFMAIQVGLNQLKLPPAMRQTLKSFEVKIANGIASFNTKINSADFNTLNNLYNSIKQNFEMFMSSSQDIYSEFMKGQGQKGSAPAPKQKAPAPKQKAPAPAPKQKAEFVDEPDDHQYDEYSSQYDEGDVDDANDSMQVLAANSLKRQLMKFRRRQDKDLRLEIDNAAVNSEKSLESFMDILEQKNVGIDELVEQLVEVADDVDTLFVKITRIGTLFNNETQMKQFEAKSKGARDFTKLIPDGRLKQLENISKAIKSSLSRFKRK